MAIWKSFSRSFIRPGILGAMVAFLVLVTWAPAQAGTAKSSRVAKGALATAQPSTSSQVVGTAGVGSPAITTVSNAAFIRVNQVGYEAGTSARAYLMSTAAETGATFSVINSGGGTAFSGPIGAQVGSWANCSTTTGSGRNKTCSATSGFTTNPVFSVYALDFTVPGGDTYYITVSSAPVTPAPSPVFPVASPATLYEKLLGNTLFYYDSVRDGPDFVPGPMSPHPSHLNNENAAAYYNPPINSSDFFTAPNTCDGSYTCALTPYGTTIDASGGWWDAGDNMKYVETESYAAALMQIGVRDFPNQMGPNAPANVPSRPGPVTPNFYPSTQFIMDHLMRMYDDSRKLLYFQVGNTQDWTNFGLLADYDIWRLPWFDDNWQEPGLAEYSSVVNVNLVSGGSGYTSAPTCSLTGGGGSGAVCTATFSAQSHVVTGVAAQTAGRGYTSAPTCTLTGGGGSGATCSASLSTSIGNGDDPEPTPCSATVSYFICHEPVFVAQPAGSATDPAGQPISPNLAGRLAADFALYYQLNHTTNPSVANQALKYAEDIFAQADLTYSDPAGSAKRLLTIIPFDGYGESVWEDDMELGATEIYFALQSAEGNPPGGLLDTNPIDYLKQAATFANNYITNVSGKDTLNLYDVSGLAHFELYRAMGLASSPSGLATTQSALLNALESQLNTNVTQSGKDAFGFGINWRNGDTTSHGDGISTMASEVDYLTGSKMYDLYSRQWLGNMMGANSWGVSLIIGDGTTWTNCPQQQPENLLGSLTGGFPELYGAAVEGPAGSAATGGYLTMVPCPLGSTNSNPADTYAIFNGVDGNTLSSSQAVYRDNVQAYNTTEPAIDLTSTSFLMFSWRIAGAPATTSLTGLITATSGSQSARNWTITLNNNGPFGANAAEIDSLHLTQTGGAACSPLVNPAQFPVNVGNIGWGGSALGVVTINFTGCPSNARFTVNFTFDADGGKVTGSKTLYNQFQ
ncbi:MAG TPA: glycoside hydrolase family 9 protein [Terriglobia bacterium]|nr:glycoside hydrolase family 9 protein [Terriglobia bacterium]